MNWARDVWPSERARLMSAHMMPIERQAAEATVEILEMNSWLEDDVKCESQHAFGAPACTVVVTHRGFWCRPVRLICDAAADYNRTLIRSDTEWCRGCNRLCADCWRVESA